MTTTTTRTKTQPNNLPHGRTSYPLSARKGDRCMWRLDEAKKHKYLAARALGLTEQLLLRGWPGLSAKDAGRIGAQVKMRKNKQ